MYPLLSFLLFCFSCAAGPDSPDQSQTLVASERLQQHAADLKKFAAKQKASTQLGILVDMSLPSWKKRLFVVNMDNDSVLVSGLCAHGRGDDVNSEEVVFSNTPGSNCTADGRYRIGAKYSGEYGLGYKLYGLDSSNSNAYKRYIVLHYYPIVPEEEDKGGCCRSNGCPMVTQAVFKAASKWIDASDKPVLLWIYK